MVLILTMLDRFQTFFSQTEKKLVSDGNELIEVI